MTSARQLQSTERIRLLAEQLSRCPSVTRFDKEDNREAWTLAHAFGDLEESFRKFLDDQLPKLLEGKPTEQEIAGLLLEIGEEFRHILYHIKDPLFFRYLGDASNDSVKRPARAVRRAAIPDHTPTERRLLWILHRAWVEARNLAMAQRADQLKDLADAMENILAIVDRSFPTAMETAMDNIRLSLKAYQNKYAGQCPDYLAMLGDYPAPESF